MNNERTISPSKTPEIGYFFTVTDEQMLEHRKRSITDIFMWLESANSFVRTIQTPQERWDSIRAKSFVYHN